MGRRNPVKDFPENLSLGLNTARVFLNFLEIDDELGIRILYTLHQSIHAPLQKSASWKKSVFWILLEFFPSDSSLWFVRKSCTCATASILVLMVHRLLGYQYCYGSLPCQYRLRFRTSGESDKFLRKLFTSSSNFFPPHSTQSRSILPLHAVQCYLDLTEHRTRWLSREF